MPLDDYEYNIEIDYKSVRGYTVLRWTTEPPTQEGWYWVCTKYSENFVEKKKVVMLYCNSENVFQYTPDDFEFFPDDNNFTHYLGPLPIPDSPKE